MITTINEFDFRNAFLESDTHKNKFSIEALNALFDYFEETEEQLDEQLEFDMTAICCEYTEYKTAWEAMEQYQPEDMPTVDIEDTDGTGKDLVQIMEESEKLALEWLNEHTTVIEFDGGVIVQNF